MTPEWLGSWWRAYGRNRALLCLVFVDGDRRVVGIAPLFREHKSFFTFRLQNLRMVGAGSGDSDALDFIVKPGAGEMVAKTFVAWLEKETSWDTCCLETLAPDSATGRQLLAALDHQGWPNWTASAPHFFVDLPPTWEAYLQGLAPEFRPLLTRYAKRLQGRYRVRICRCEGTDQLVSSLQALFTLHQMRWMQRGEPGAFSSPERRDFYLRMAEAFLRRGWLEFWLLALDDETVAVQFCFRYRDTVYLLQEGFNPKYAAEKVGYALRAHVLKEMIAAGAKRYDFLGGDDRYKLRFGASQDTYFDLQFAGDGPLGRACVAQQRQARQSKRWIKSHLPSSVLALLQRRAA
jgi:CelD/BcsL family acetyltransferase involved in cellulose biosynthesis